MKKRWIPWIFLAPSLFGVFVFVLLPFLDVVRRSFGEAVGNQFAGWKNYQEVLGNQAFLMAGKNTLRIGKAAGFSEFFQNGFSTAYGSTGSIGCLFMECIFSESRAY